MWFNYSESTLGERFMVIVVYPLEGFTTRAANMVAIKYWLSGSQFCGVFLTRILPLERERELLSSRAGFHLSLERTQIPSPPSPALLPHLAALANFVISQANKTMQINTHWIKVAASC